MCLNSCLYFYLLSPARISKTTATVHTHTHIYFTHLSFLLADAAHTARMRSRSDSDLYATKQEAEANAVCS